MLLYLPLLIVFELVSSEVLDLNVLHLGETGDNVTNEAIASAVEYVNSKEDYKINVQLESYLFSKEISDKTLASKVQLDNYVGGTEITSTLSKVCERINNMTSETPPMLILDTTGTVASSLIANRIIARYGLLSITVARSLDTKLHETYNLRPQVDPSERYWLRLLTPSDLFPELIIKIIRHQEMNNAVIFYTKENAPSRRFFEQLKSLDVRYVRSEYTEKNFEKNLDAFKKMYFWNFFFIGKIAVKPENFTAGQVAYSLVLDESDVDPEAAGMVFAWPVIKNKNKYRNRGQLPPVDAAFHFELAITAILTVRKYAVDKKLEYKDGICDESTDYPKRKQHNYHLVVEKDKTPIFGEFKMGGNNHSFMRFDVNVVKFTDKKPEVLAKWTAGFNSDLEIENVTAWKEVKAKPHYKVLARIKPPFVYYNESNQQVSGYSIDLLDAIAKLVGFTYQIEAIHCNHHNFVKNRPTTKAPVGFVHEMLARNVDIGLGPIPLSRVYGDHVDVSIPYYKQVGVKFVLKRFKDDSIFTFITVLESIVWGCILAAFCIISFMLWAVERLSPYSYRNNKQRYENDDEEPRDFTVRESLWFCITSLTPQGGGTVPKHISGRLVVVTWWLFGFIILASYTANLSAFLTLSKLKNPIESFDDLYKQFGMQYAPLNGSDEEAYFEYIFEGETGFGWTLDSSRTGYAIPNKYKRMNQIIYSSALPSTVDEALARVYESTSATEGFAFITDAMDAKYLLLTKCNLIDVDEELGKRPYVLAFPKFTILKYDIDEALTTIMQNRWTDDFEEKWWEKNPFRARNCVELEDELEGIGIYNSGGVFLIILVGMGIGSLMITCEYWMYKRRQRQSITVVEKFKQKEDERLEDIEEMPKMIKEIDLSSNLQQRVVQKY